MLIVRTGDLGVYHATRSSARWQVATAVVLLSEHGLSATVFRGVGLWGFWGLASMSISGEISEKVGGVPESLTTVSHTAVLAARLQGGLSAFQGGKGLPYSAP